MTARFVGDVGGDRTLLLTDNIFYFCLFSHPSLSFSLSHTIFLFSLNFSSCYFNYQMLSFEHLTFLSLYINYPSLPLVSILIFSVCFFFLEIKQPPIFMLATRREYKIKVHFDYVMNVEIRVY